MSGHSGDAVFYDHSGLRQEGGGRLAMSSSRVTRYTTGQWPTRAAARVAAARGHQMAERTPGFMQVGE